MLLLLLLGVGASFSFRGTKKDYMLASHSIGPFLLLMSLFGTTMTAFALVGSTGEAFKEGIGVYGMLASSSGIIHSLCFFVIGIKLWRLGRENGYTTQTHFFRDRLDNDWIGLLLFPILVGLVIPYLLIGVMAGGTVIQTMTGGAFPDLFPALNPAGKPLPIHGGIPTWLGSMAICLVVLTYVFFGGMRGTAWANAMQTIVFMVLGVVTFYFIAMKLGGMQDGTLMENLRAASSQVSFDKVTRSHMSQTKFLTYMLIPFSVGMFPHLFQHWLTAKSANSFKVPVVLHPLFIMIVWVPCVLIGVWATTVAPLPKIPGTDTVNVNAILPFLVKTQLKALPILGGLLTTGILAAIMSSLDSQFLCIGTLFNDMTGHHIGKDRFSDKQQIWMARGFIVLIVAITYVLSLLGIRSVFTLGVWCFSGFASLFPLVFAALYWRRLTAAGAIACVLTAIGTWSYLFYLSNFGANRSFTVDFGSGEDAIETMPVLWIFLASTIAMVVVSLVTKPPSEKTLSRFFPEK